MPMFKVLTYRAKLLLLIPVNCKLLSDYTARYLLVHRPNIFSA